VGNRWITGRKQVGGVRNPSGLTPLRPWPPLEGPVLGLGNPRNYVTSRHSLIPLGLTARNSAKNCVKLRHITSQPYPPWTYGEWACGSSFAKLVLHASCRQQTEGAPATLPGPVLGLGNPRNGVTWRHSLVPLGLTTRKSAKNGVTWRHWRHGLMPLGFTSRRSAHARHTDRISGARRDSL
jgi:hypothetical protein